jgi:uncharacterized protein involved in exopolysaccharide biosynthesis
VEKSSSGKPSGVPSRQLTVRDMVAPLFRKWRIVLITFFPISALALFLAWGWASDYYASTMQVVVGRERSEPTVTSLQGGDATNSKVVTTDEVASEVALLQGRDMLQEVVQTCNLAEPASPSFWDRFDSRPPEVKKAVALESATKRLAKKIKVEAQKTSHVIDLRYGRSGSPETPACVLQTLGKLYLEKHVRLQRPTGASEFFAQETDKYRRALTDSENRLVAFSKTQGIAAPEILRTDMAQQLVMAQSNLFETRQLIAANEHRVENIQAQMGQIPARSSTSEASISSSALLEQLKSGLLSLELKRTQLLLKYESTYPLVKEVDQEIAQTKDAIQSAEKERYVNTTTDRDPTYEYLRQDKAKTEADLASERATAAALSNTIQGMQSEMVNLDVNSVKQAALLRDTKANEGNYLLYLNKREQERTSDALDQQRVANVAIAVPANVPALPAYNPIVIMIVGFLLAAFAGIGAGYLAEFMDPSFRTPDEVADMLKVTVLAAVPKRVA